MNIAYKKLVINGKLLSVVYSIDGGDWLDYAVSGPTGLNRVTSSSNLYKFIPVGSLRKEFVPCTEDEVMTHFTPTVHQLKIGDKISDALGRELTIVKLNAVDVILTDGKSNSILPINFVTNLIRIRKYKHVSS